MFPRILLKFRVKRGVMVPLFLDPQNEKHRLYVNRVIAFYESNLGRTRNEISFDDLRFDIGDDRLADGLRYAIEHIYRYTPKETIRHIRSSPLELRFKLFRFIGSTSQGFAEDRRAALKAFQSSLPELHDFTIDEVDSYLWSDDERSYMLTKSKRDVSCDEVIRYYNFEVLDTILSNSKLLRFISEGSSKMPKGTFVKNLVREVKKFGLLYDAGVQNEEFYVDIYGPVGLFGRATKFSWRLSALFNKIVPLLRDVGIWTLRILVHFKMRELPCILTNESLPELASDVKAEDELIPMFDSNVERKFYGMLSSVSGFKILREAEPIIVGDTLLVPDYIFERSDGVKWYLEIIGFWRPEYTAKKKAKLLELKKAGFQKLILLVDQKYVDHFKDIGFTIFTYQMKGRRIVAPFRSIINTLKS